MKKIIIFDVMGVIFEVGDDTNELLVPYLLNLNSSINKTMINEYYKQASLGEISSHEFWMNLGFASKDIEIIEKKYLETCLTLDQSFIGSVKKIKDRGYITALLSNDVSEWGQYLRNIHDIDKYIDFTFISGDVGIRKPDPEIYKIALEKMDAKPSECIFIDDDPLRVEAAEKLYITSILFNRECHKYNGLQIFSFSDLLKFLGINER